MNNVFPHESTDCANLPKTIALIGKYQSQDIAESIRMLARYLHERGMTVLIEEETARNVVSQLDLRSWTSGSFAWLGAHADMAIVAGGDGTMLNAARQLARYRVPLVGVNQGRLGFMTDISRRKESELALRRSKEEAEAANQANFVFKAKTSHEI